MKIAAIINKKSYNAEDITFEAVKSAAHKFNLTCDLFSTQPNELEKLTKSLIDKNYEALLIAGGDGSIRTVAQVITDYQIPLAILPIGTFNHFATTLNIPNNIEKVMSLIHENKIRKVDLGKVNNHIFINNSSIGMYPRIVKKRNAYSTFFSKHKIGKMILTALNFFAKLPVYNVKLTFNNQQVHLKSCLIFIGSNYYSTDLFHFGHRESLEQEILSVYVLKCVNKKDLFALLPSLLLRVFNIKDYLEHYMTKELLIETKRPFINAALDGEIFRLQSPLHYTIVPKILSVYAE